MLLNHAWQFGSEALAAPQATLMKMITEGVMEGNLPWTLIFIGVFIGVAVEIMGVRFFRWQLDCICRLNYRLRFWWEEFCVMFHLGKRKMPKEEFYFAPV